MTQRIHYRVEVEREVPEEYESEDDVEVDENYEEEHKESVLIQPEKAVEYPEWFTFAGVAEMDQATSCT